MSPKVSSVHPGRIERSAARSMYPAGVTHTGHPGPEISAMSGGSSDAIPNREI